MFLENLSFLSVENFSCHLRHEKLNIITGARGSGKTALVFGALYEELARVSELLSPSGFDKSAANSIDHRVSKISRAKGSVSPVLAPVAISGSRFLASRLSGLRSLDLPISRVDALASNRVVNDEGIQSFQQIFDWQDFRLSLEKSLNNLTCGDCGYQITEEELLKPERVLSDYKGSLFACLLAEEACLEGLIGLGFSRLRFEGEEFFLEDFLDNAGANPGAWCEVQLDEWLECPDGQQVLDFLKLCKEQGIELVSIHQAASDERACFNIGSSLKGLGGSSREVTCPACVARALKSSGQSVGSLEKSIRGLEKGGATKELDELSLSELRTLLPANSHESEALGYLCDLGFGEASLGTNPGEYRCFAKVSLLIAKAFLSNLKGTALLVEEPFLGLSERETLITAEMLNQMVKRGNLVVVTSSEIPNCIEKNKESAADGVSVFSLSPVSKARRLEGLSEKATKKVLQERTTSRAGELLTYHLEKRHLAPSELENLQANQKKIFPELKPLDHREAYWFGQERVRSRLFSWLGIWRELSSMIIQSPEAAVKGIRREDLSATKSRFLCQECKNSEICRSCGGTGFGPEIMSLEFKSKSLKRLLSSTGHALEIDLRTWNKKLSKVGSDINLLGLGNIPLTRPVALLSSREYRLAYLVKHLSVERKKNSFYWFEDLSLGFEGDDLTRLCQFISLKLDAGLSLCCGGSRGELKTLESL